MRALERKAESKLLEYYRRGEGNEGHATSNVTQRNVTTRNGAYVCVRVRDLITTRARE